MSYKQFVAWCNERACDGQWSIGTALACIGAMDMIRPMPFWKREKAWQKFNTEWQIEKIFCSPLQSFKEVL